MIRPLPIRTGARPRSRHRTPLFASFLMTVVLVAVVFYIAYPVLLIFINSFNTADIGQPRVWSLENWRNAFGQPRYLKSLGNSAVVFGLVTLISFPIAVGVAWSLARVRMPFSNTLEFLFWLAFMIPGISSTIGWMLLMDPSLGFVNKGIQMAFPFLDLQNGPFNIFGLAGIVWAHVMGNAISSKVMLLTPAFRNMDTGLEEAARVSGATNFGTMLRVTLPVMIPPMVIVFALNLVRMFESFETEQLLGAPVGFFVYSTEIFRLVRNTVIPQYGEATALAAITLILILFIVPLQRWLTTRRLITTVTGRYRPGKVDLGRWTWAVMGFIVALLTLLIIAPILSLLVGSFMWRAGFFELNTVWTLEHWVRVLTDNQLQIALRNTFLLATSGAVISPILFSIFAYIIVRTQWGGRKYLDSVVWLSAAFPGMLSGLGLLWMFLGTPGLNVLYGTLWALILVTIMQGKLTGTQMAKGTFLQMGAEMEEQARIAGAGWIRTYIKIWIPLMMPTLLLLGVLSFVIAASTTSSIILLATRGTMTLSIMALEFANPEVGLREEAGIVSMFIVVMTAGVALVARSFGVRVGLRNH